MNEQERREIQYLPPKYRPLGAWGYFGYTILFCIPLIGFICLIAFACSSSNINRRSFARSYFCWLIIGLIIGAVIAVLIIVAGGSILGFIQGIIGQ